MTGALEAARSELERRLADHARRSGATPPTVCALGETDALRPEPPAAIARRALADVQLTAEAVLIGPWGGRAAAGGAAPGGAAGCGNCLAVRWQRLRGRAQRDALETGTATTGTGGWPLISDFGAAAVWAAYRLTSGDTRPADTGLRQVTAVDLATLRSSTVPLLAEPCCPYCGESTTEEHELRLLSRPREPGRSGEQRLRTPASYQLPVEALVNPVCGALGAGTLTDIGSPTIAPVAGAILMRTQSGLGEMTWSGKADSFRASRDLALLEGLERYAGTHRRYGAPPLVASYEALVRRGEHVLDPRDCGSYAPGTYADEPEISPFEPTRPIPWVWGYSLRGERPVLVPLRLAYYCEGTPDDAFVDDCSNGCAIGSCLEEAVLSGLLELIERDAFLLAWYADTPATAIDLDACGGDSIRGMLDRAHLQGYDLYAFDSRADLPIPVVTSLAVRRDGGPGTLSFAAAAAFDPAAAIEAALAETLTYLPQLPARVAARLPELTVMAADFSQVRELADHSALFGLPSMARHADGYLRPASVQAPRSLYADWQQRRPRSQDLRQDVLFCRDALVGAGFDVIAVDQTSPEQARLGLRTVRMLVPGLLPMDFGWSRQRALRLPRLHEALANGRSPREVPHPFS
ncbi:TOMM precursor leader peptide-binding protein [Kitasatospora sp. NBC_01266]|uniref:TOMM precursor leader peptide-binding protein n=1 Tax=Kitasatospora sp. NBC_01266 TaxID=2903572 RepID=UPI002E3611E6|nr:TOMM precursor leader peptide-binding protein [Kitasatospora sp. NBC_01266]